MVLWKKTHGTMKKKIWYYTKNSGTLINDGKNYGTMEKLWFYSLQ